jgi:hypothetical protein
VAAADQEVEYAALSYCWGTSQSMLVTSTLAELQSGVHPSYFSRSIQDAIKVVVRLGFRHLWVDAICILQDDPGDMAKEIQKNGRHILWCQFYHCCFEFISLPRWLLEWNASGRISRFFVK